jgi:hypothetical protein
MTTLTTRKEILETKKLIGSTITRMQIIFFDETDLQFYKDDNEEHLYMERFDHLSNEIIEYKTYNKLISLNHFNIDTFCVKLTEKLIELFKTINSTEFFIISHLKLDFFGNRDNKFKPLKKAYKNFEKIVGDKTYKEAFSFNIDSLADFIEILFWITRCDASGPEYIFLFDKGEKIQIHLCKYGNIHLTEFNQENLTTKKLKELGWTIIEGEEYDNFSDDGKIQGKRIKI